MRRHLLRGLPIQALLCAIAAAAPTITTPSLPSGTVGAAYSRNISVSGQRNPVTWSISAGALPPGLTLAGGSGNNTTVSGTPTAAGTYSFTVRVVDANNESDSQGLSILVNPAAMTITTATLPNATYGVPYSEVLQVSGGSAPYSWVRSGGSLPAGLSLSANGTIAGTPAGSGVSNFTVSVADNDARIASKSLSITVTVPPLSVVTASLPNVVVGTAYSQTLAATGGTGGYTWSRTLGSLPAGLSLTTAGTIAGTPTTAGVSNFTVTVRDNSGTTANRALTITVDPTPPVVTTSSLPGGQVGQSYSQALAASGGSGGYTWSVTTGSLPAGLSLSAAGVISGTPTAPGSATFTVTVADSGARTGSRSLSIAILPAPLTVTTASLPNGQVGVAYSQTLQAAGGSGGNRWTAEGALPAGLSLSAAGAITGTPTAFGSRDFTVTVTDSANRTASKALSIAVDPPPLVITTASLPNGQVGAAYSQTLQATGGSGGNRWTAEGALPAGLSLSAAGAITGTPTAFGSRDFTVTVTDSGNRTASKALSIVVDPPPLVITTASLPNGQVGAAYSQTLQATGGSGGNRWTVEGALPAGLSLSAAGAVTGTPTAFGSADFTVTVTDSGNRTASKALSIVVDPAPLVVTTASLPNGQLGIPYSQTLQATGGSGGNRWTAVGALPAGLSLSAAGTIAGTPTAFGSRDFTVTVTDNGNRTASRALSMVVEPPTLTIATASLPNGNVGAAYSQTLEATGGSGGNRWTAEGALPAGLTLSAAGAIAGTPTAQGTREFTVTVTDSGNRTASKALSIAIGPPILTVTTATLPSAVAGTPYSFTLAAAGGSGGNTWSVTTGTLPAGLTLGSNGTIGGTPTTPGTANVTIQVRDSANATATKALTLTITPPTLVITTQSLPAAIQGSPYSQTLAATGGTGGYRWSISAGSLPTGLSLETGGRISGTVSGGSSTFTVEVADTSGAVATRNFSLSVTPPLSLPTSGTLPSGVTGAAYAGTVAATGGQAPYTFSVVTGQLPPGLALDAQTGAITGRPTQVGSFSFAIQVRDAANAQIQAPFTIAIANTLTIIDPPVLPSGSISAPYQVTLTAAGGAAPYNWSATAGSLPAGVTFRPDGSIAGTPTTAGQFTFTASVTDAVGGRTTKEFSLTIAAPLTITTGPQLPQGVPSSPYNTTLAVTGGAPPYVWIVSAGSLPPGLRLDAGSGAITGIPESPLTANFTVTVTDSLSVAAQKAFTLTIAPGVTFSNPATLPNAVAGTAYSFTLTATGGGTPYSWRISDGALPAGLALVATSGVISGTPASEGTFNFTVEVTDAAGLRTARVHTLVVDLPTVAALSVTGVPATLAALQQPQVDLVISNPYPVAITGRLNLAFVPATGMPDDPAVQFSSGGRSTTFTIAANDTRAAFSVPRLLIQSGSVAGAIQFTVESLRAGAATLPNPNGPIGATQVPAAAAVVRSVEVRRTSGGFDVLVAGATTTRELGRAIVRFSPPAGATLQTSEVTVELAELARAWFQAGGSMQFGGQFTLTLPFSFVGGPSAIEAVTVILANNMGSSQEVSGPY